MSFTSPIASLWVCGPCTILQKSWQPGRDPLLWSCLQGVCLQIIPYKCIHYADYYRVHVPISDKSVKDEVDLENVNIYISIWSSGK